MTPEVMEPHFVYTVDNAYTNCDTYDTALSQDKVKEVYESEKCENGACKVDVVENEYTEILRERISMFVDAVDLHKSLMIVNCVEDEILGEEVFVLENSKIEDEQTTYPVSEVMLKCTNPEMAGRIVRCLAGEEKAIVLNGITRIVGYYSRMSNWNASKIGELRNRNQGNYKVGNDPIVFNDQRMKAIEGLSQR